MAKITGVTPQVKDKTRCNIEVDGRFFCGMDLETVVRNRLKAGDEVTEEALARMQLESEKQTALDKALTHISASMKTEREIRAYLARKGYLEEVADHVVEKMKAYGYLDDEAYAKSYAESAAKRKGSRLIAQELRRRGVGEKAIGAAIEELSDETESAKKVLGKYLRGKDVSDVKTVQRAYAYLVSKGFGYETARAALQELSDGE